MLFKLLYLYQDYNFTFIRAEPIIEDIVMKFNSLSFTRTTLINLKKKKEDLSIWNSRI
jgi:hypothetical protein